MRRYKIIVDLLLPNGKDRHFSIDSDSSWKSRLKSELLNHYPRSTDIRFVREPRDDALKGGKSFKSNVMFEIRKNYFELGHITARIPPAANGNASR